MEQWVEADLAEPPVRRMLLDLLFVDGVSEHLFNELLLFFRSIYEAFVDIINLEELRIPQFAEQEVQISVCFFQFPLHIFSDYLRRGDFHCIFNVLEYFVSILYAQMLHLLQLEIFLLI